MRNKDLRLLVDVFKYYYIAITKNEGYRFNMTDSRKKMMLDFIQDFKTHTNSTIIQEDYLRKFVEYQFNYWYAQDTKYGKGTGIQPEWILGTKAWKRWLSRTEKQKAKTDFIIRKGLKKDVKLKKVKKYNKGAGKHFLNLNDAEEIEKELFYNTAKGFVNCMVNTTLYNHKSTKCAMCKYSTKCKKELRLTYPSVNKLRGY